MATDKGPSLVLVRADDLAWIMDLAVPPTAEVSQCIDGEYDEEEGHTGDRAKWERLNEAQAGTRHVCDYQRGWDAALDARDAEDADDDNILNMNT